MTLKGPLVVILASLFTIANAQLRETFEHRAEYGASVGLGHYFGDLNTIGSFQRPKITAGIFYRKQFNNYVGIRFSGNYSFLGYSDAYSNNIAQKARNLSFNTDVWDVSVNGDFNFFKFYPEIPEYRFTPYISLGIGAMYFNPYAYLNGRKVMLRELGTEGQGSAQYPGKKKYSNYAMIIPIGFGLKYNITDELNIFADITYRFTTTDYLDDVSGTYAPDAFDKGTFAYQLQDRSYEVGPIIGEKGRQRGNSVQKDSYMSFQVGISVNILNYRCPTY